MKKAVSDNNSASGGSGESNAPQNTPDITWGRNKFLAILVGLSTYKEEKSRINELLDKLENCINVINRTISKSEFREKVDLKKALQSNCKIINKIMNRICKLANPDDEFNRDEEVCDDFKEQIRLLISSFERVLLEDDSEVLQSNSDTMKINESDDAVSVKVITNRNNEPSNNPESTSPSGSPARVVYPEVSPSRTMKVSTDVDLPSIGWNRQELSDIIGCLSEETDIKFINEEMDQIENRLEKIKKYKKVRNVRSLYINMLDEIDCIFERLKYLNDELCRNKSSFSLWLSIDRTIKEWLDPLHTVLSKLVVDNNKFLEQKTQKLYAQQSYVKRNLSDELTTQLHRIRDEMASQREEHELPPICYISYAWLHPKHRDEYWVQPFLSILYGHLLDAGIRIKMDIHDVEIGDSIPLFMKEYSGRGFILSIGTRSLLEKHHDPSARAVKTELNIIRRRVAQDKKRFGRNRTFPLLLSGTITSSYPEDFELYRNVRDARDGSYFDLLENLIAWLNNNSDFSLWQDAACKLPESPEDVRKELLHNYHGALVQEIGSGSNKYKYHAARRIRVQFSAQVTTFQEAELAIYNHEYGSVKAQYPHEGKEFQRPPPMVASETVARDDLYSAIENRYQNRKSRCITVLGSQGQGGVGKTYLARRYYLQPPIRYNLRAWFNASDRGSLIQQYIRMAESEYNITYPNDLTDEQKARSFLNEHLQKQETPCLFVYDGAPKKGLIETLLPEGNYHLLVTTREKNSWAKNNTIPVSAFSELEACELINNITQQGYEEKLLIPLAQKCKFLPIVLKTVADNMYNSSVAPEACLKILEMFINEELREYLEIAQEKPAENSHQLSRALNLSIYTQENSTNDGEYTPSVQGLDLN